MESNEQPDQITAAALDEDQIEAWLHWLDSCKWRDASKEIPPTDVVVIISTEGETQAQDVWLGQLVNGRWRYPYSDYFRDLNVTHWMPTPPKAPRHNKHNKHNRRNNDRERKDTRMRTD